MVVEKKIGAVPGTPVTREDVSGRRFPVVRRGFDPAEVSSYLTQVAAELEHAERQIRELLAQRDAAEERARHPSVDEAVLASSLGQHSAAVLREAHEEASRLLSQAQDAAAVTVRDATSHANEAKVAAESAAGERIARAELEANAIVQRARDASTEALDAARAEGEATVERAREHGRNVLDEVNVARQRALDDLAARRRLVTEQIERLRAARDEIASSVLGVRRTLDQIVADLSRTDEAARAALGAHVADEEAHGQRPGGTDPAPARGRETRRAPLRVDDVATKVPPSEPAPPPEPAPPAEQPSPPEPPTPEPALLAEQDPAAEPTPSVVPISPAESLPEAAEVQGRDDGGVDGLFARLRAADGGEAGEVGEASTESVEDASDFARRAAVLDPIVTTWARRLKRALRDDQNRLLDRLRQEAEEWRDGLLPDEELQRATYVEASTAAVRECMAAGGTFGRGASGVRQTRAPSVDERAVEELATALGEAVVSQLRRRLENAETLDVAERVGAAYREWRGERIEALTEDAAVEAFSRGVVAGVPRRSALRWVRSLAGPGCADCEDNALAGSTPAGEGFPTGHVHPPAHAGCRCLVLPIGKPGGVRAATVPGTSHARPT